MEGVYKGLDEVKAEMEKLKEEYRIKAELSENLKTAHSELLLKFQEAKLQIEEQGHELNAKTGDIIEAGKIHDGLKSSLEEKELSLRHLSSANEKLRVDLGEKLKELEGKNRELMLALDETTARNMELEQKFCASNEEIEGLKKFLLVSEKKRFEAEKNDQAIEELRQREDTILKLEEENRNAKYQLKWKKEQFQHLEEAHKRLQDHVKLSTEEWEVEKLALLETNSSLQTSLGSQTRISEALQAQLKICNQALAHEESQRKLLEVQVSEIKTHYENIFAKCEEEKSKIECFTVQRDEEIAMLRNSLGTKEILSKEMEFRIVHLEQENKELGESLKELREAQIQEAQIRNGGPASLLTKLRNKLGSLEQEHSNCSTTLRARDSEWTSQIEKMKGDIFGYVSNLKGNEKQIQELQMDVGSYDSKFGVSNEEISLLLRFLKSEFSEVYLKLLDVKTEMQLCNREKENNRSLLTEQLEVMNRDLNEAHLEVEQNREEVAFLMNRVEPFELMEQQYILMEEELERHKKMLEESSECQILLEAQVLHMENALKDNNRVVFEALEREKAELAQKIYEGTHIEYELQNWKSSGQNLEVYLEEKQEICKQTETSLLAQAETEPNFKQEKESLLCIVKEQRKRIDDLEQQIHLLEATIATKTNAVEAFREDEKNLILIAEQKDNCIENLHKDINRMKHDYAQRESEWTISAALDAQEKRRNLEVTNEKDQSIQDLRLLVMSLEEDLTTATASFYSEAIEKQVNINSLNEALQNAEYLTEMGIQQKNNAIVEFETEVNSLQHKLAFLEKSLFHSKQHVEKLQSLVEAKELEIEKLRKEQKSMEGLVKELEFEKGVLLQETIKLTAEREDILVLFEATSNQVGEFDKEDVKLMKLLSKILQSSKAEIEPTMDLIVNDNLYGSTRTNTDTSLSLEIKKLKVDTDERSPLKDLNH